MCKLVEDPAEVSDPADVSINRFLEQRNNQIGKY